MGEMPKQATVNEYNLSESSDVASLNQHLTPFLFDILSSSLGIRHRGSAINKCSDQFFTASN